MARTQYDRFIWREKETAPLYTQSGRASLHGCLLGLLSSHSLAQNDCGHISNIRADPVAVADGENPLSARPDKGSPPFSLTKPVRLPSSLDHCRDMGSCRLPPPSSRLSYVPQVQLPLQLACTTAPAAHITPCGYFSTSLPRTYLYWLLHTVFVMSLCLIN